MEINRDRDERLIKITMTSKIDDIVKKYPDLNKQKNRLVSMPTSGYLIRDEEFEHVNEKKRRYLNTEETKQYMGIVGLLIWIQGVLMDIIFTVLYLSWFTQKPRQHHLDMAYYCLGYLENTKNLPLVFGGMIEVNPTGYSDAALGNGPKGRSITREIVKLNEKSGAVMVKATAGHIVMLSSFEGELDEVTRNMKILTRICNLNQALLFNDNKAMINFVHGEGTAKGVRQYSFKSAYFTLSRLNIFRCTCI
jgi:hypothetical protein